MPQSSSTAWAVPVPGVPPRPAQDDECYRIAAAAMSPQVLKWCGDDDPESTVGRITGDLVRVMESCYESEGYALAKRLEELFGYSPDAKLVDILSAASFRISEAHRQLVVKWVLDNHVTAKLAIGDKADITVMGKSGIGEITAIHALEAKYTVFCDFLGHVRSGIGTHGLVLPFEEVEVI